MMDAAHDDEPEVDIVQLKEGWALLTTGERAEIAQYLDEDGNVLPRDEWEDAAFVIIKTKQGVCFDVEVLGEAESDLTFH
jgi:hypothetical protein